MIRTPEKIREAMVADGYTDPPTVGDQWEDLNCQGLSPGHREVVTITDLWKLTDVGWSASVSRREVDDSGNEVLSGCGQGFILVDRLLAGFRKVGEA